MNKKEIAEIRRRLAPDKNAIGNIYGCYVNTRREIIATFSRPLITLPQEEAEKYLAIFKRTLSGIPGKNLLDIVFRPDQVMDGEEHRLLTALRNTELKVEQALETFYQRVIDSLRLETNYLILLVHDAYDLPYRFRDEHKVDDAPEEVFNYILCSVCPVKPTKPALSYWPEANEFHDSEPDWVVSAPELGFMFPAFDDRASNIYNALYYTRDTLEIHDDFIAGVFNTDLPEPADAQKEQFQSLLEETLDDECSFEVVQSVHEQLRDMIEAHNADKAAEPLVISRHEVSNMLEGCGVSDERVTAFEEKYDEQFGFGMQLNAQNIVNPKKFEVRMPDVVIQVNPEHSDMLETRVIDGVKYILIRADEGVEVNGVNISIADGQ